MKLDLDALLSSSGELSKVHHGPQLKAAAEAGLKIVDAEPDVLQVDIDEKMIPFSFGARLDQLRELLPIGEATATRSRNGNIHAYIKVGKPLDPLMRCVLQMFLGSDEKREVRNAFRILLGVERPIVFFEKADAEHEPI